RDDHVLLGDEVLELELLLGRDDLRATLVAAGVDRLELEQLLSDQRVDPGGIAEDRAQLADSLLQIGVLLLDALALEAGERAEPEVEDRLRLDLAEREALHQLSPGVVGVVRGPNERDDLVDRVERDQVAGKDVRPV